MNYQAKLIRGNQTELKFFEALQSDIRLMPYWYLGVRRPTGIEDADGVDAFVTLDVGEVKVQIKTSQTGRHDYEKFHKGNGVLVIVLEGGSSLQYAKGKILDFLYKRRGAMMPRRRGSQRARH